MKKRGLFLSALFMSAVFAGCSNEEVLPDVEPREVKNSDSYIAVNIVAPGVDSRGEGGDFVAGTDVENTVNKALFVFFDAAGNFVEAVDADTEELKPWTGGTGSVEKLSNAVIVLSNPSSAPKQVVALLNTDLTEASVNTEKPSLTALKAIAGDYSSETAFVMSNSVYEDANGKEVTATALTDANVQKSAELAKQNPVTISVERVLAKVTAAQAEEVEVTGKDVELNGEEVTLVPEITGFKLVATNPASYLVKNIGNYSAFTWNWNDAASWRSYWANSATPESYNYFNYEDVKSTANYAEYCLENTDANTPTQLLVSATIKAEGSEGDAVTILKYKGLYYTVEGLKTKVNEMLAEYKYETTVEGGTLVSNDWAPYLDIVDAGEEAKPWEVKVALKADAPVVAGVADVINDMDTAIQWTDGQAYFFVPIEHFGDAPQNIGIVRNHYYKLNINAISGLGTPVYDPTEEIIPEKLEEEEYFVAAQIQILKWKIVSQQVSLN